jgi:hypothetical protein
VSQLVVNTTGETRARASNAMPMAFVASGAALPGVSEQ